jgi:hypothetical protein
MLREENKEDAWEQNSDENIWTQKTVTIRWRKFHNEEFHTLYSSPNINVTKCRRLKWVGRCRAPGERARYSSTQRAIPRQA